VGLMNPLLSLWFRPLHQCLSHFGSVPVSVPAVIAMHGLSTKKVVYSLVCNSEVTCVEMTLGGISRGIPGGTGVGHQIKVVLEDSG
jgi:hypothetical protein